MDEIRLSKLLSQVLRHDPGRIGITLDPAGWVSMADLVLAVAAGAMHEAGHRFTRSANGVWLVDSVPPSYLTQADGVQARLRHGIDRRAHFAAADRKSLPQRRCREKRTVRYVIVGMCRIVTPVTWVTD